MFDSEQAQLWNSLTPDEQVEAVDVTQLGWRWPPVMMDISVMIRIREKSDEFQKTLNAWDPRHEKMFAFEDGDVWLNIYWGGAHGYPYELERIKRPEDLLWLVHHISKKSWEHMTVRRVGMLLERVSRKRGWPMYGIAPHPNEAPKPNHDRLVERQKMTPSTRYAVIKRDGYRCRACGFGVQDGAHLHVDHIVAVANGGETKKSNLQTLCTVCNLGKAAK